MKASLKKIDFSILKIIFHSFFLFVCRAFFNPPAAKSATSRSVCLNCNLEVPCTEGSTTTMRSHLKSKHPKAYQIMVEEEQLRKSRPESASKAAMSASSAHKKLKLTSRWRSVVTDDEEEASVKSVEGEKTSTKFRQAGDADGLARCRFYKTFLSSSLTL